MQQRAKSHRRVPRLFVIILSVILALVLGVAGFALYAGARSGVLGQLVKSVNTPGARLATPQPTPASAPTLAVVALKAGAPVGPKGAVTLAWSPDGSRLAIATNPAAFGGVDPGGVALYGAGTASVRLAGFEERQAPGSLVWSPDGKRIAAVGRASIIVWDATTGNRVSTILVPASPGNTLSIFAVATGVASGAVPATVFLPTGFAQWAANGTITAATMPITPSGMPPATGALFALWGSQAGTRIFRDANDITQIGAADDDRNAHAAFMRWSPDGRFILWGYPRLPISSTLAGAGGATTPTTASATAAPATAINAPNIAFATLVNRVGQATRTSAAIIIWPSGDGARLALYDTTVMPPVTSIVDAANGATIGALPAFTVATPAPLNMLSWQGATGIKVTLTTEQQPAVSYASGG